MGTPKKAIEVLELCAGLVRIVRTIENQEEAMEDDRIMEYHGRIVQIMATDEEAGRFVIDAMNGFESVNRAIERSSEAMKDAAISGTHDCDECEDAGKCPIEAMVRAAKAKKEGV